MKCLSVKIPGGEVEELALLFGVSGVFGYSGPRVYRRDSSGEEFLALGALSSSLSEGSFGEQAARVRAALQEVGGSARGIGWAAFDEKMASEEGWEGFGRVRVFVPEVLVIRSSSRPDEGVELILLVEDDEDERERVEALRRWLQGSGTGRNEAASLGSVEVSWPDDGRFRTAVGDVAAGKVAEKVVLARRAVVKGDEAFDCGELLQELGESFPACTVFGISPGPGGPVFLGATPERLGEVESGKVQTMALAGTIGAGGEEARLLESGKDLREHRYVVEMIRDGLSELTTGLEISERPEVVGLSNVKHLRTPIRGELKEGLGIAEVVEALHPTPAVCGVPGEKVRPLIGEFEGFDRGLYAGTMGWMNARGEGSFDVLLRCALVDGEEATVYTGAGITAESEVEAEVEETARKAEAMLGAFCRGGRR